MPINKQEDNVGYFTRAAMLYDFYGALLTEKQRRIIEMYFMDDLSLSEIGGELGITRQAAGILINRAFKLLDGYESKLELIKKHYESKGRLKMVAEELTQIRDNLCLENDAVRRIDNMLSVIEEL